MSIKVTGKSRSYKIKISRDNPGGFRDLTAIDRKLWAHYLAY